MLNSKSSHFSALLAWIRFPTKDVLKLKWLDFEFKIMNRILQGDTHIYLQW